MSYFEDRWGAYVSVAEKRRQAHRKISGSQEERRPGRTRDDRRSRDHQELLGQSVVQQSRTLQRFCQPAAARP